MNKVDNLKMRENVILAPYTSMYVGGLARYFLEVVSVSELISALNFAKENKLEVFILGGGSNVIISDDGFKGLVIRMNIVGKKVIEETDEYTILEVGAGYNWDDLVDFSVGQNLYGIENLSHIPGTVGASVVQNIGAYGQEVSEVVQYINVINRNTFKKITFSKSDLDFSYRKSRFNDEKKDKQKYVVVAVVFKLIKNGKLNIKYTDIQKYFYENTKLPQNLKTIREAVISIRNSKFPFPNKPTNGTVGSFWNAEVVDEKTYGEIIKKLKLKGFDKKADDMINKKSAFTVAQGFKVVAGLFIEVLGYKGKTVGGAKILETHAGIINNFTGNASAKDILDISDEVTQKVFQEFGVRLRLEPELVGDFKIIV